MTAEEISLRVVEILNEHSVPYMLVGSLSTNFHATVRSTKGADVVVQSDLGGTARIIAQHCRVLHLDPQLGFEHVTGTNRIVLRAEKEDFVVELFGLSDDPHDQRRFERRQCVDWQGRPTWIASVEDALITKLRWGQGVGREKDIADARNMIAVREDTIDWAYVETWCDQHGSRPLLDRIRNELRQR